MNKTLKLKVGTEFGSWLVISDKTKRLNNITNWKCRCVCGTEEFVPLNNLMNGSSTQCVSCARKKTGLKKRKGVGDISGDHWVQIKNKLKKRNPTFKFNIEKAWDKYLEQEKKCMFTDQEITLSGYPYDYEKTTAEYIVLFDNQGFWVHKNIAKMLSFLSMDELLEISIQIVNTFKNFEE